MRIGFIGTGNITSALVTGLCTQEKSRHEITLSPRNREKSACLAAEYSNVEVASGNQAVIDSAELVVLALRPQIAMDVIRGLHFHDHQKVLTLVAATPISAVCLAVSPAAPVLRAVPLPSTARHVGPILLYPDDAEIFSLLGSIGELFVAPDENQLSLLSAITALITPFFSLLDTVSGWAVQNGIEKSLADAYTVSMFHALSEQALNDPQADFSELAEEAATPGGLNEQAHNLIAQSNGYEVFLKALDAVATRIGRVPQTHRLPC